MTPAELKTLRESLGLTAQWVADQAKVKLRTVQYWERGRMSVPADVAAMLIKYDRKLECAVQEALSKMEGTSETITLRRYLNNEDLWRSHPDMFPLPTTSHAAMLGRLWRELRSRGINSTIHYMEDGV